jgi:hypothetical protein
MPYESDWGRGRPEKFDRGLRRARARDKETPGPQ